MTLQILRNSFMKAVNFTWRIYNLFRLYFYGIKHGRNIIIQGKLGLYIAKNASIYIGNDFYCSSGNHINPLSRNIQGNITVFQNANLIIGDKVGVSSPTIWAHSCIKIGNNVKLGANVIIMDSDAHSINYLDRREYELDMKNKENSSIIIQDDVLVGVNSIILKGVTIGARSVIGAGSIVTKSIPADCIAAGNPAKVIKYLK